MTVLDSEYELIGTTANLSNSTVGDLFFATMGGQDPIDVAGIWATKFWLPAPQTILANPSAPGIPMFTTMRWEVRWDTDPQKGEHVNVKIETRVPDLLTGTLSRKTKKWAIVRRRLDSESDGYTRFYSQRFQNRAAGESYTVAHKQPATLQALTNLTRTSGYSYTEAVEKRRTGGNQAVAEYRVECAQVVLNNWSNMMEDFYAGAVAQIQ
jgi:hypothetical protein